MRAHTHMTGSRIVVLLAAVGTLGACGDDDASETAGTDGQESVPAVTDESTVTRSIPDEPDMATASTTVSDVEPWVAYTFYSPTDEPEGVSLVHADGSDDHEILAELPYPALNPDWSPDGTRLAVQIYSRDSIWIANADGSQPEVAARCTDFCGAIADPAWSPSGEQLLVIRLDDGPERGTTPPDQATSATVELVDLRTREQRDVLHSAYPELLRGPTWSPDGLSYAVTVQRYDDDGEQTGSAIALGGLDGSPLKLLTPFDQWANQPDWHPQDDTLVYGSGDEASNVFTISADGSDVQAVTEFEPGGTRAEAPVWTPDGERIIFATVDDPAEVDQGAPYRTMASIKPDGTGLERMPLAGPNGYHYTMQPTPG
jgi:Tol biopolymer transport system component